MRRSEFKLLVENWRGFLNESAGIENILKRLYYLENEGKLIGEKIEIYYDEDPEGFGIISYGDYTGNGFGGRGLSGSIEFERSAKDSPYGFALGGYSISETHKTTDGFGPLLYEIIIEKVSEKGSFLMCDRSSVSKEAKRVWDIYMSRPDIQKVQLDINKKDAKNYGVEQLTPENDEDDTSMKSAMTALEDNDEDNVNWMESSLSKGYYKEKGNTPILDFLRKESNFIDFIES